MNPSQKVPDVITLDDEVDDDEIRVITPDGGNSDIEILEVVGNPNQGRDIVEIRNPEVDEEIQEIQNPNLNQNPGVVEEIQEIQRPQNPEVVEEVQEIQNPQNPEVEQNSEEDQNPESAPEEDFEFEWPEIPEETDEDRARFAKYSMANIRIDKKALKEMGIDESEDDEEDVEDEEESEESDGQLGLEEDPDPIRRAFDDTAADWSWQDRFKALGIKDPGPDWVPKKPLRDEPSMTFTEYKLLAKKDDRLYQYINTEWEPDYLKEHKDRVIRFKMDFSGLETYTPQWYRWIKTDRRNAEKAAAAITEKKRKAEEQKAKRNARAREIREMKKKGIVAPKRGRQPTASSGPIAKRARKAEKATKERARGRRMELVDVDTSGPSTSSSRRRQISQEDAGPSTSSGTRSRSRQASRANPGRSTSTKRRQSSQEDSTGFRSAPRASRSRDLRIQNPGPSSSSRSRPKSSSSVARRRQDSFDSEEDPNVPGPSSAIYRRRR